MSTKQNTNAQPLASESASVSTLDHQTGTWSQKNEAPPEAGQKIIRYEMYCRDSLGDRPVKDDDGFNCVYTNAESAIAHLDLLPECDMDEPAPRVYFYRAVYEVDSTHQRCTIGNCTKREKHNHWYNGLRSELVTKEVVIKNGPRAGEVEERTYVNASHADRAAMRNFRDMRNARLNATADTRSDFQQAQKNALVNMLAKEHKVNLSDEQQKAALLHKLLRKLA